jgi:acetoin utilization protein AcuB
MLVREWMTRDLITVTETTPLLEARRLFLENEIRHLPVVRDGQLVGIVSDRDLNRLLFERGHEPSSVEEATVYSVMTTELVTVHPEGPVSAAALLMHNRRVGALPVVEGDGTLVGILTVSDLLEILVAQIGGRDAREPTHSA